MSSIQSDPPIRSGSSGSKVLDITREEIHELREKKVDITAFDIKIEAIEKDLEERKKSSDKIKSLALDALNKKHDCIQQKAIAGIEMTVHEIYKMLDGWKTVKLATIISIILLVTGAVASYVSLQASVGMNADKSIEIKRELTSLKEELKTSQKDVEDDRKLNAKITKEELKELFKSAVFEIKSDNVSGKSRP